MIRGRFGNRRSYRKSEALQLLFATGRQLDSAAAQIRMLAEDELLTDQQGDELEDVYQELQRIIGTIDTRREQL